MNIKKIDHLETLIGSIEKMFLNAKNKGVINNKELALLNLIYKILKSDCFLHLTNDTKRGLMDLYYKLLNKYSFLCKTDLSRDYNFYGNIKTKYIDTNKNTAPTVDDSEETDPPTPATIVLEVQDKNDVTNAGYKTLDGFIITTSTPNDTIVMKITYVNNSPECPHPETFISKDYSSGSNETSEVFGNEQTIYLTIHTNGSGVSERWLFDYVSAPACITQGTIYVTVLESELSIIDPDNQTIEINTMI